MPPPKLSELDPPSVSRRGRFEIRSVIAIVILLVVAGALYGLVFGSPNRNSAVNDSSSSGPPTVGGKIQTPPKPQK